MERHPDTHGLLYAYGVSGTLNQVLCRIGAISGQVTHLLNQSSLSHTEHSVSATFDD